MSQGSRVTEMVAVVALWVMWLQLRCAWDKCVCLPIPLCFYSICFLKVFKGGGEGMAYGTGVSLDVTSHLGIFPGGFWLFIVASLLSSLLRHLTRGMKRFS